MTDKKKCQHCYHLMGQWADTFTGIHHEELRCCHCGHETDRTRHPQASGTVYTDKRHGPHVDTNPRMDKKSRELVYEGVVGRNCILAVLLDRLGGEVVISDAETVSLDMNRTITRWHDRLNHELRISISEATP